MSEQTTPKEPTKGEAPKQAASKPAEQPKATVKPKADPKPAPVSEQPAKRGKPFRSNHDIAKDAARAAAARARRRAEQAQAEKKAPDESGLVWYMGCRRNPDHIGVFLTRRPDLKGNVLADDQWWASYKPIDAPHFGPILCQSCREEGRNQVIHLRQRDVRSMEREAFEQLLAESEA